MYRVVYQLPFNSVREIYMNSQELSAWLRWNWLKERIISYERISQLNFFTVDNLEQSQSRKKFRIKISRFGRHPFAV